jgi:hypothetical protein
MNRGKKGNPHRKRAGRGQSAGRGFSRRERSAGSVGDAAEDVRRTTRCLGVAPTSGNGTTCRQV